MDDKYGEDERLLSEIKTGSQQFIKSLFQSYWDPFQAFITKLDGLPDEEIAELYVRAFTTFYFNIKDGKLAPPLRSRLKTYLFGIGRNYLLKRFKEKQKEPIGLDPGLEAVQRLFQQPDIVDYYELEWQRKMVENLLKHLEEPCRKILILTFIEENSDDAIKEKMDIPSEVAVRQRRFNCLEKLRKLVRQRKEAYPSEKPKE